MGEETMEITFNLATIVMLFILIFIAAAITAAVIVYWLAEKKLLDLEKIFRLPKRYALTVEHHKDMEQILNKMPRLNIFERIMLIQNNFGRPVRLQLGMDNQAIWLEAITPYSDDDEFSFMETLKKKDKDEHIGVG